MTRYIVTAIHGESASIFHVIDGLSPDQPCIVFSSHDRATALAECNRLNTQEHP